jgi:hypothetical protein
LEGLQTSHLNGSAPWATKSWATLSQVCESMKDMWCHDLNRPIFIPLQHVTASIMSDVHSVTGWKRAKCRHLQGSASQTRGDRISTFHVISLECNSSNSFVENAALKEEIRLFVTRKGAVSSAAFPPL